MAKTMSIQVKKCKLRNTPSFLGKIIASLDYADQVTVQKEKKEFYIPAIHEVVKEIDLKNNKVTVIAMEGMLELNEV